MQFEDWWEIVLSALDKPREIRNWTPRNGYTVGGRFIAFSYRSLSKKEQSDWNNGYPFTEPDNWIVHSQVKGERLPPVSKKEFRDRYDSWPAYRNGRILRKHFNASPYVISIFHEFEALMSVDLNL